MARKLEAVGVPCGPVNDLAGVFSDPQVLHRSMKISLRHKDAHDGQVNLIGNPINYSKTPVTYRKAPPTLGEDSLDVLSRHLKKSKEDIDDLAARGIISLGES